MTPFERHRLGFVLEASGQLPQAQRTFTRAFAELADWLEPEATRLEALTARARAVTRAPDDPATIARVVLRCLPDWMRQPHLERTRRFLGRGDIARARLHWQVLVASAPLGERTFNHSVARCRLELEKELPADLRWSPADTERLLQLGVAERIIKLDPANTRLRCAVVEGYTDLFWQSRRLFLTRRETRDIVLLPLKGGAGRVALLRRAARRLRPHLWYLVKRPDSWVTGFRDHLVASVLLLARFFAHDGNTTYFRQLSRQHKRLQRSSKTSAVTGAPPADHGGLSGEPPAALREQPLLPDAADDPYDLNPLGVLGVRADDFDGLQRRAERVSARLGSAGGGARDPFRSASLLEKPVFRLAYDLLPTEAPVLGREGVQA